MKTIPLLLTILLVEVSLGEEPHPFSGKWDIVGASHKDVYKKDGLELPLKSIEFRRDKKCVLYFESAEGVKATIENRFVAGFEELVLIQGEKKKNTSVEIYGWSLRGGALTLIQSTVVGGPDSDPPDTTGLDEDAADLLLKLSKTPKKVVLRMRFKRSPEQQNGAAQPAAAGDSKAKVRGKSESRSKASPR